MKPVDSTIMDEIYEALDNAHRYQDYIMANCAFHEDSRPSLMVYPDWFKCLSCGANGPTSTLLQKMGKVVRVPNPYKKEQIYSDNPFTRWMKTSTLKSTLKVAWETINTNSGMGNYITQDRGIEEPYRKRLGIGYIDDWYTIPIRGRNGTIISAVARKGRDNTSQSKYVLPNNTNPQILYVPNWHRVRNANYLIITFGILDAIVLAMIGEPSASTITGKHLNKLSFASFRIPILLIPDRQEELDGLAEVQKLGWRGKSIKIDWPEKCKDINDIWITDRQLCRDIVKEITNGFNRGI